MKDTVGVLITSYNQEALLKQAIESVLNQSMRPDKIVIVDDASEDNSRSLIESFRNTYPRIIDAIFFESNMGVSNTRREGFSRLDTRYVTYLDGDDLFSSKKLEKELELINKSGTEIVFSDNYYIDQQNNVLGSWAGGAKVPHGSVFRETFSRDYPRRNLFRMEMVEYSAWAKIGFHDEALSLYEDYDMRIRLTKNYRTSYLDLPLSYVRLNTDGLSKRPPYEHVAALHYIYKKNKILLGNIGIKDRRHCRRMYSEWILIFIRAAVKQARAEKTFKRYVEMQTRRFQYMTNALWNWL